jgi:hypothetical protein
MGVWLKKGVEEEDLSLREEVHVERSKCDGVDGRRKGLVGRAEGLSREFAARLFTIVVRGDKSDDEQ